MNIIKSSLFIALLLLIGRVAGLLRELTIAHQGGASLETDYSILILTFPDLMISILLGGGLTAALVPAFRNLEKNIAVALLIKISTIITIFFGIIFAIAFLYSTSIISTIAPGIAHGTSTEFIKSFQYSLIAIPVTALSGVIVAYLNGNEKFIAGASGTLIFNGVVILFTLTYSTESIVFGVCLGVIFGALTRLLFQFTASIRLLVKPTFSENYNTKELWKGYLGGFGFASLIALIPVIGRALASFGDNGDISLFNYTYKIIELPIGIIASSMIIVLLPKLSNHFKQSDHQKINQNIGITTRTLFILLTSISIATIFFSPTIVTTIFFSSNLTPEQLGHLNRIISIAFWGMPFQGLLLLYGTIFIALKLNKHLIIGGIITISSFIILSFLLKSDYQLEGIFASYVISNIIGFITLATILFLKIGNIFLKEALYKPYSTLFYPITMGICTALVFKELSNSHITNLIGLLLTIATVVLLAISLDSRTRSWLNLKKLK